MSKFYFDTLAGTIKLCSDNSVVEIVTAYNKDGVFDKDLQKSNGRERLISLEAQEIYNRKAAKNRFMYGPFFWEVAKREAEKLLAS